jgi:hypothetical protein
MQVVTVQIKAATMTTTKVVVEAVEQVLQVLMQMETEQIQQQVTVVMVSHLLLQVHL